MTAATENPIRSREPIAPLAVAMLGFFVIALDAQIVNVALPDIRISFGGGLAGLQWVVTSYLITFSALQLFSGTLSDGMGARRTFGIGLAIFIVASMACALAPSLILLVAGRILQGVGAAMMTPSSLGLIRESFPEATERGKAIVRWALGGSIATAAGPIVGGALTQLDWRLIFIINIPVGAVALLILSKVPRSAVQPRPFDWTGQITVMLGLGGLTFGIIEGAEQGYESAQVLGSFALGIVGCVVFVFSQVRGRHPMIQLSLFSSSASVLGLSVAFVNMAAFCGVVFLQSLYFQQYRALDPLTTGLLFLPMSLLVVLLNPLVALAMERFGKLQTVVGGQVSVATGLVALSLLPQDAPVVIVALVMVPIGVGGSITVPPLTTLIVDRVPAQRAGTAGGVLNSARQLGGALGVATFGAVLTLQTDFLTGLLLNFRVAAALVLIAAVLLLLMGNSSERRAI